MSKGRGTKLYFDTDSDDQYRELDCVLELTLPGYERGVIEGEPCLEDDYLSQDTGDLKLGVLRGAFVYTANETNIDNALETVMKADTAFKACVKLNYSTPVYVYMTGKLSMLSPRAITRERKYSRDFEFLLNAHYTYSATGPTLEA